MENRSAQSQPERAPDPRRIMLFGELLVDVFRDRASIGGAPFNVARHLRSFGMLPLLISRTGDDALGETLSVLLNLFQIDRMGIQIDAVHPTGQVRVCLHDGKHDFEILPDQAYDYIDAEEVRRVALTHTPSLVYFGTLAQRNRESLAALQTLLKTVEAPRLLDLNLRAPWYDSRVIRESLAAADVLKLNEDEFAVLAHVLDLSGRDISEWSQNLMKGFALQKILVTMGAGGAWLLNADGTETHVRGNPETSVMDTVGAGDAFAAVFILGLLQGWPDRLVLERADAFARAVCGIRGAVPMDDRFYEPFVVDWATR